jgi:cation diffusion facilitator CzcD-associated flavoprotein CzcO
MTEPEHVDVLIVGAGLSGIGAACHLQRRCPRHTFAIVEARATSGGTWDLFRYPGVRSDSDMFTLGYAFRPWHGTQSIADGASILRYLRDTAAEHGIDRRIRYGHRVARASWSSGAARWTVEIERDDGAAPLVMTCGFLFPCSGYYRYDTGYAPAFPGVERFGGRIVHPQFWTDDIAWEGRRVVVIGSGATAMTLVPALAERAAHVTLLQRSPTWVVALPAEDPVARVLRVLPRRVAHAIVRWKNVLLGTLFFRLCRRRPDTVRRLLGAGVRRALGTGTHVEAHFTPRYNPWEQRLCVLPDGDLFRAIRAGRVSMVTDHIDTFTGNGIALASGRHLDADLVVSATGLELLALGGIAIDVDGARVDPGHTLQYKGSMLGGVPNLVTTFGYTNASWTLKSDLIAEYVCRLLVFMRRGGFVQCTPRPPDAAMPTLPWVDFSSGYLQRALARFPKQGARAPWRLNQNYLSDIALLRCARIDDGVLEFAQARA